MTSIHSNRRGIAALLLFFLLGLLFINARSMSHDRIPHLHAVAEATQAALEHPHEHQDQQQHQHSPDAADAGAMPAEPALGSEHTHEHNPGDHTHDLGLRYTFVYASPHSPPGWLTPSPQTPHSVTPLRLDRPPKATALA